MSLKIAIIAAATTTAVIVLLSNKRSEKIAAVRTAEPTRVTPGHTSADFAALMIKHNVPVDNDIEVGSTGYLDRPATGKLSTGVDRLGRKFITLPVNLVYTGFNPPVCPTRTFTVFQRYSDNERVFVLARAPKYVHRDTFLKTSDGSGLDWTHLDVLLSGKAVTFTCEEFGVVSEGRHLSMTLAA